MHQIRPFLQWNGQDGRQNRVQVGRLQQHQATTVRERHQISTLHRQLQLQHEPFRRRICIQTAQVPRQSQPQSVNHVIIPRTLARHTVRVLHDLPQRIPHNRHGERSRINIKQDYFLRNDVV